MKKITLLIVCLLLSCSKSETSTEPSLLLSVEELSVGEQGGEVGVQVTTTEDWSCSSIVEWCTVTKKEDSVLVRVDRNNGLAERTTSILVKVGTFEKKVKLIQGGAGSSLAFTHKKMEITSEGQTLALEVVNNGNNFVAKSEELWITAMVESLEKKNLTLFIDMNTTGVLRQGRVIIISSINTDVSDTLLIVQDPVYDLLPKDSLALVALYQATNGLPGWDLIKPVKTWEGVEVNSSNMVKGIVIVNWDNIQGGYIPKEIGDFANLETLKINAGLTGDIPKEIGNLKKLRTLNLLDNNFSTVPNEIAITGLNNFHLDNLKGLPEGFWGMTELEKLEIIFSNSYNQSITTNFKAFQNLKELYITNINSTIFPDIVQMNNLQTLDVRKKKTLEQIPPEIKNLKKLLLLSFIDSELYGNVPKEIEEVQTLRRITLTECNLEGSVSFLNQLPLLQSVILTKNKFTGSLALGNLTNLELLALGDNQLSGNIPKEIGTCVKLQEAHLQYNMFTGEIPEEINNCKDLRAFYCFWNQLSGKVPTSLLGSPVSIFCPQQTGYSFTNYSCN